MDDITLISRAIKRAGGMRNWRRLTDLERKEMLFNKLCPAGGEREQEYHCDGPRYWEKNKPNHGEKPEG